MYIELLILVIIAFVLFAWAVWYRITNWTLKRRYKEENDKGRKAEEFRTEQLRADATARESSPKNADSNLPREGELEGRSIFPSTTVDSISEPSRDDGKTGNIDGETSKSNGKTRRGFLGIFRRRTA